MEKIHRKWWPIAGENRCVVTQQSSRNELTLENFAGVFAVLCVGLITASITAMFEISFKVARKKKIYKVMAEFANFGLPRRTPEILKDKLSLPIMDQFYQGRGRKSDEVESSIGSA